MKRLILMAFLVSAVGALSGCTHWVSSTGNSEYQTKNDLAYCEYEAEKYGNVPYGNGVSPTSAGIQSGFRQSSLTQQCMKLKGYYLVRD